MTKNVNKSAFPALAPQDSKNSEAFFKNFMIESIDQEGRTSLRQIMKSEKGGRTSILN